MESFKIIIYNNELLEYFTGDIIEFCSKPEIIEFTPILDNTRHFLPGMNKYFEIQTCNSECMETIKLDETLMRRIAKYNKEKEIQKLDEKIKEKESEIKRLDDILKDRNKRVEKLKKYIAEIYDIDINDDDDDYDY